MTSLFLELSGNLGFTCQRIKFYRENTIFNFICSKVTGWPIYVIETDDYEVSNYNGLYYYPMRLNHIFCLDFCSRAFDEYGIHTVSEVIETYTKVSVDEQGTIREDGRIEGTNYNYQITTESKDLKYSLWSRKISSPYDLTNNIGDLKILIKSINQINVLVKQFYDDEFCTKIDAKLQKILCIVENELLMCEYCLRLYTVMNEQLVLENSLTKINNKIIGYEHRFESLEKLKNDKMEKNFDFDKVPESRRAEVIKNFQKIIKEYDEKLMKLTELILVNKKEYSTKEIELEKSKLAVLRQTDDELKKKYIETRSKYSKKYYEFLYCV